MGRWLFRGLTLDWIKFFSRGPLGVGGVVEIGMLTCLIPTQRADSLILVAGLVLAA